MSYITITIEEVVDNIVISPNSNEDTVTITIQDAVYVNGSGGSGGTGADGDSAYQIWLDEGNAGTEQDFLNSLVGPQGPTGPAGADSTVPGPQGPQGIQGETGPAGPTGPAGADSTVPGPQGPQGIQGETGPAGPAGADGAPGETNTINSDTTGEPSGSDVVLNVVSLTQAEYNAGTPVSTTFYIITDA